MGQLDGPGAWGVGVVGRVGGAGHGEQVVVAVARQVDLVGWQRRGDRGGVVEREVVVVLDAGGRVLLGGDGRLVLVAVDEVGIGLRVEALAAPATEPGDRVEARRAGGAHLEIGGVI